MTIEASSQAPMSRTIPMPSPEERIVAHDALLAALAENKMTVSEAVRAMRQAMFMSIDEYAELTQVNKRYLTAIELNEGKSVSIDILEALSAPYGLALGFVRPTSRRWKADVKERQARRLKAR